ncbi:MAG: hypothetical protein UX38_C0005G0039 [Microgenomates group bacterium GW2011_GWC1_46_16]|uniref:Methyltransferase type 11 domain-containing protein n=2 Tax=Candidatus Collieribacteriota TaxID=1752725 RepID=A0A1F5FYW1_9BACT|nr:MAG: hypothetical protein UX32_C0007G0020 [Microgenomates group bacterium GW2011_GWF1_46_12]KKU26536.1 MAG: hypothetical protein UX38_C0005G0039 [Microgenomates group bacterium GW2011_GWC1_46_16]KKU28201.1 MAG: hypothetical protein UX40_C0002G0041 [Microgenomates group bacterium GW2011_GWF2_46_18]KKU43895.1 MAG: hypothetical protein UX59_C0007G0022 [Microgenomates group bacterium GW2011_GWA1_46_7]KKU45582.1 MAG: hypothetical protein UX63_C0003G0008 [Microgenomates group bacterium GW2011_GWB1
MVDPKVFEGYSEKTQQIIKTTPTDRGIEMYADMLGFPNIDSLISEFPKGCRVLDIGAGKETLKKELAVKRPDLTVFSINPSLAHESFREANKTANAIIAINPELPVESGSFDVVIDSMGSVYYSQQEKEYTTTQAHLFEITRVLKNGGKAYIGPTFINPNTDFEGKGRVGMLLDKIRGVKWSQKEFNPPGGNTKWRSYQIEKAL